MAVTANTMEVRDVDLLILTALDFQPFASRKFCQLFGAQQSELFTDDSWRNASISGQGIDGSTYGDGTHETTDENMSSFSSLTTP